MNTIDIITAILNGAVDADLNEIVNAIQTRRKVMVTITAAQLRTGDTVRLKNIRPAGLIGIVGTVIGKKNTRFIVQLDEANVRRVTLASSRGFIRNGNEISVPQACLDKVAS